MEFIPSLNFMNILSKQLRFWCSHGLPRWCSMSSWWASNYVWFSIYRYYSRRRGWRDLIEFTVPTHLVRRRALPYARGTSPSTACEPQIRYQIQAQRSALELFWNLFHAREGLEVLVYVTLGTQHTFWPIWLPSSSELSALCNFYQMRFSYLLQLRT